MDERRKVRWERRELYCTSLYHEVRNKEAASEYSAKMALAIN